MEYTIKIFDTDDGNWHSSVSGENIISLKIDPYAIGSVDFYKQESRRCTIKIVEDDLASSPFKDLYIHSNGIDEMGFIQYYNHADYDVWSPSTTLTPSYYEKNVYFDDELQYAYDFTNCKYLCIIKRDDETIYNGYPRKGSVDYDYKSKTLTIVLYDLLAFYDDCAEKISLDKSFQYMTFMGGYVFDGYTVDYDFINLLNWTTRSIEPYRPSGSTGTRFYISNPNTYDDLNAKGYKLTNEEICPYTPKIVGGDERTGYYYEDMFEEWWTNYSYLYCGTPYYDTSTVLFWTGAGGKINFVYHTFHFTEDEAPYLDSGNYDYQYVIYHVIFVSPGIGRVKHFYSRNRNAGRNDGAAGSTGALDDKYSEYLNHLQEFLSDSQILGSNIYEFTDDDGNYYEFIPQYNDGYIRKGRFEFTSGGDGTVIDTIKLGSNLNTKDLVNDLLVLNNLILFPSGIHTLSIIARDSTSTDEVVTIDNDDILSLEYDKGVDYTDFSGFSSIDFGEIPNFADVINSSRNKIREQYSHKIKLRILNSYDLQLLQYIKIDDDAIGYPEPLPTEGAYKIYEINEDIQGYYVDLVCYFDNEIDTAD